MFYLYILFYIKKITWLKLTHDVGNDLCLSWLSVHLKIIPGLT